MAVTAHFFDKFQLNHLKTGGASLTADTLKVGLTTGTFNWVTATETYEFVSDFTGNAGSGGGGALTEVTGTGYSRQALTSVTYTQTGNVVTLTCANPSWSSSTFTAGQAFFYDSSIGSGDSTYPIICYWDFGGAQSVSGATFTLSINASGLVTWTAS